MTAETKAPLPESVGIVVTSLTERFGLDEAKAVLVYREEYETLRVYLSAALGPET